MTNSLIFKYYAAVIYPLRFLFKYGYLPKVKTIVPLLSCIFMYNLQNLVFADVLSSHYCVLFYVIIGIVLLGVFDIFLFQKENETCQKIINLPSQTNRISFLFYFVFVTILIV
jgi:hypothetical protein